MTDNMESQGLLVIRWIVQQLPAILQEFAWIETITGLMVLTLLVAVLHFIVRRKILSLLNRLGQTSSHPWYHALLENKVPHRALLILPLLIFYIGFGWVSDLPADLLDFFMRVINAIMILVIARSTASFLSAVHSLHLRQPDAGRRPIKSYIQLGKVLIYLVAVILILAQLAGLEPWYFISGIGAVTAIIMLIFRDTLLSLVASVQLTNNDLIRVGDWIEMQQFGADGDVVDIALNTVRVQNWDKTFTVIPTHKFLDHSFRNWRGMQESGGRRIMRELHLDIESIRFLTLSEVERLKQSNLLNQYITDKLEEVSEYNRNYLTSTSIVTNGRWLTNVGTFRAYVMAYLKKHPRTHKELLTLVRQLQPTANGLPLQIYTFTNTIAWVEYESIQADIFDHLLAILPEFGLRHYQRPSGRNMDNISLFQKQP